MRWSALISPGKRLIWLGIFLASATGMTWPLVRHLPTHLPLGTEPAATVPLLNLWTLMWNAQRLAAGYQGYWDAPIFFPARGTFALADPQPATGLLFAPLYFASRNPVLAYNLVLLAFLTLNGYAAAVLAEGLLGGRGTGAAVLSGLLAQGLPFVFRELGVLQLTPLFPVFFGLHSLRGLVRGQGAKAAVGLGVWTAVTFLTSAYYGLFLGVFLVLAGGVQVVRAGWGLGIGSGDRDGDRDRDRDRDGEWGLHPEGRAGRVRVNSERSKSRGGGWVLGNWVIGDWVLGIRYWVLAAGVAGVLALPVLVPQARLTAKYFRSERTIRRNSAQWVDYVRLDVRSWGHAGMPWLREEGGSGQRLYPGTGLLGLAVLGFAAGWRGGRRGWAVFCAGGAALAVLISLGLNLHLGEWHPYQLLRSFFPGYAQLRSPFRMAVFVQVFLVGLAALGVGALWGWRGRAGRGLAILIVVLSLIEVLTPPARLWSADAVLDQPDWARWLATQPEGAVVMLPFNASGKASDFEDTTVGMVLSLFHGKPLVNGYSGFFPYGYRVTREILEGFPSEEGMARLRKLGVVYVVTERGWLTPERAASLEGLGAVRVFEGEGRVVFSVR